jgi:hypothetical protein
MNYNDFFNRLLLEAVNNPLGSGSRYDIPNGIGAEGLADDNSDPAELENDLAVNGQPKGSVDGAKALFDSETNIRGAGPEGKKEAIKKAERFLSKLEGFLSTKELDIGKKYSDMGILADLVRNEPEMINKYNTVLKSIERFKEADELRKKADEMEREEDSEEEDNVLSELPDANPNFPQV